MVKLIVFDFDGVLEDTYESNYRFLTKEISNLTREEYKSLFDGNVYKKLALLAHRDTGFDSLESIDEERKILTTNPEIVRVLEILAHSYTLGIITSSNEKGIHEYLTRNNISSLFTFVYGYETSSSKEEKFKKLIYEFSLKEKEIVFVTDTLGDILEAHACGIRSVAVDFGYHDRARLEQGNPWKIVSKFDELLEIFKK